MLLVFYVISILSNSTTCYWRIKFWDDEDHQGAWSTSTASFSLAAGNPTSYLADTVQNIFLTYDAVGNITQISDLSSTTASHISVFDYDDLHRLTYASTTQATSTPFIQRYIYSSIGNMTEMRTNSTATSTYTYSQTGYANPHAATSIGGTTLGYDDNGNLTSYGSKAYAWDYRNRLASSTENGSTTTYGYDHTNQRVKKVYGGVTTLYPSQYYSVEGATSTKYIFAGSELIASIEGTDESAETTYIHTDHLGSTNAVTDSTGAVVKTLDYYPFGSERVSSGLEEENRTFIGQYHDEESDLSYLNARYYEGSRGQFLSQDPVFLALGNENSIKYLAGTSQFQLLTNPQSLNSYSYANNNPINKSDPNGLSPITATLGAIAGILRSIVATLSSIAHPDQTFTNTVNAVAHPIQTGGSIYNNVKSYIGSSPNQDVRDFRVAEMTAFFGAGLLIGPKGAKGAGALDDAALVCRGGVCTAEKFAGGSGVTSIEGKLYGVSVMSKPGATLEELGALPQLRNYGQIGATTPAKIEAAGGMLVPAGGNFHFHINGLTPQQLEGLFTPTIPNPAKW